MGRRGGKCSFQGRKLIRFEYLSPPLLLSPKDLDFKPDWVHLVSFPDRTERCLDELTEGILVAWEPEPVSLCKVPRVDGSLVASRRT